MSCISIDYGCVRNPFHPIPGNFSKISMNYQKKEEYRGGKKNRDPKVPECRRGGYMQLGEISPTIRSFYLPWRIFWPLPVF